MFQKLVTNPLFGWEICAAQQDTLYPLHDSEQVIFYKKTRLYIIGNSVRNRKITNYLQVAQSGIFQSKFDKLFLSTLSNTL